MFNTLRFLIHYNPGWAIIFFGTIGLTGSSIVWFFEYFERLSVKLLMSSAVLLVAGILLAIVAEFAKDMKKEHDKKLQREGNKF